MDGETVFTSLKRRGSLTALAAGAALVVGLAGCSSSSSDTSASTDASAAPVKTLRLGFFPNLTHAPALVGLQEGLFRRLCRTGDHRHPDRIQRRSGRNERPVRWLAGHHLHRPQPDHQRLRPVPGEAVKVISGSTSGGAALVVKPTQRVRRTSKGKKIATPQLGNTQDVAARYWLKEQGLTTDTNGGGDVSILPQSNSEGLTAFSSGQIDGAWVPEPFVAQYEEAGAKVLVDEKSLWPDGKFVTTNILVRTGS